MIAAARGDGKYYQVMQRYLLAKRLVIAARERIYADFLRYCEPDRHDTILDVGVSDVVNDATNMLEWKYPNRQAITAVGLGEPGEFHAAFPSVAYVQTEANARLPFADKSFAIATSNAVLEHVGSPDKQAFFVKELLRVARRVFISVPNRYFPVEHHTAIPLLHFYDRSFRLSCRWLDKMEWVGEENLILMSKQRLRALTPPEIDASIGYTGIRIGPFSSNLFLFARSQIDRITSRSNKMERDVDARAA